MANYWRERALAVIQQVQADHPEAHGENLRKLLFEAYPFGLRKYHPYRVWCKCVRKALDFPRKQKNVVKDVSELPLFNMSGN